MKYLLASLIFLIGCRKYQTIYRASDYSYDLFGECERIEISACGIDFLNCRRIDFLNCRREEETVDSDYYCITNVKLEKFRKIK